MWRSASSPVCWTGASENIENVTLVKKCQFTSTSQYFYLLNISSDSPPPAQTTLVAPVWASPVRAVMEAPSPLGLFVVQPPPVYRHLELIFSQPYSRYIGWVEKYDICQRLCLANTSSFRSIIDNKQCGERPGNPCGSGRPTCQCPDGQSFRLDGGDDNDDVHYYDDDDDGVCCSDLTHGFVLHFISKIVIYLISAPVSWGPCWGSLLKDNFHTTDKQAALLFQVFLLQSCTNI